MIRINNISSKPQDHKNKYVPSKPNIITCYGYTFVRPQLTPIYVNYFDVSKGMVGNHTNKLLQILLLLSFNSLYKIIVFFFNNNFEFDFNIKNRNIGTNASQIIHGNPDFFFFFLALFALNFTFYCTITSSL